MAIEKVIDIKVQGNADQAVGSLRSQLREAQADVAKLSDKFGATSAEAVKAAQKAAELKDRIGDAKSLTDAFNPDAKFKALTSSLAGVAGGFAAVQGGMALFGNQSKDLEATLLKVQSAMALSQGIQALGESMDSFKQLKAVAINAMQGIKAAIGSTGIGLLVVALGTVYAYWDDIKEVVGGVTEEQKKLNAATQKNVEAQDKKLASLSLQDNGLRLQGKSEKEILDLKIKQTDENIKAYEVNIENIKTTNKAQEEAAARNYEYLKSYLDFITIPQRYLYESAAKNINSIIDLINKIPGVKITKKIDETFADKATDYLAKLGFDPAKTKKDGETVVEEANKTLAKLKSDRDGYQLGINNIDKKAGDDSTAALQKAGDDSTAALQKIAEEQYAIREKEAEQLAELQKKKAEKIQEDFDALYKANQDANQLIAESTMSREEIELAAIDKKYQDQIALATKLGQDTTALTDAFALERTGIMQKYATEEDKIREEQKLKDEELSKSNIKLAEAEAAAKQALMGKTADVLSKGADLLGKNTAASKAMSIAAATINTYQGITAELATKTVTPFEIGLKIANVAIIAATGFKAVKDIISVKVPGGGGGGAAPNMGTMPGGGGATAPQFNVVGSTGVNQLAGVMGAQQQTPVQTYVVANNVATAMALDRNIIQSATLGG